MAKLWHFLQGHPKLAFSIKVQRRDQGKFFKNPPKSSPRLKGPKANWRKWHYPLISTHLKCKHWKTFWRKQRILKCQNGHVMAIFARSFKTPFSKKVQRGEGPREIFQKSPKKQPSFERLKSTLSPMALSFKQCALKVQRLERIMAQTAAPKVPEWPSYHNFCKVTQNPHFLKKCKGGTKGNFSKIPQKVAFA